MINNKEKVLCSTKIVNGVVESWTYVDSWQGIKKRPSLYERFKRWLRISTDE